MYRVQLAKT